MSFPAQDSNDSSQPELPYGLRAGFPDPNETPYDSQVWLRWPANEICGIRILSIEGMYYPGHWFQPRRTYRLCTGAACPYCPSSTGRAHPNAGPVVWRSVVVVEVFGQHPGTQRIWEFGQAVHRQITAILDDQHALLVARGEEIERKEMLRGLSLSLMREGQRPSGSVIVQPASAIAWPAYLPVAMDAAGQLAASWRRAAIKDGKSAPRMPRGF